MSVSSHDVIQSFIGLPESEQRVVAAEILRRVAGWDYPSLSDNDLCDLADESFRELDEREAQDGDSPAR
jgi:hypothetical protein